MIYVLIMMHIDRQWRNAASKDNHGQFKI
jgi:hypothetical protein